MRGAVRVWLGLVILIAGAIGIGRMQAYDQLVWITQSRTSAGIDIAITYYDPRTRVTYHRPLPQTPRNMQVSPNQRYLVYDHEFSNLRVLDLHNNTIQHFPDQDASYFVEWSPDAKQMVVMYADGLGDLHLINRETGESTPLLTQSHTTESDARWSPDGEQIAFHLEASEDDGTQLCVMTVHDASTAYQCLLPPYISVIDHLWTPDSKTLIVLGADTNRGLDLYRIAASGGSPVQLYELDENTQVSDMILTPDGSTLIFSMSSNNATQLAIFKLDINTRELTCFIGMLYACTVKHAVPYKHALSPDGRQVAFASAARQTFEIYTVNIDGSNLRRVTNDQKIDSLPLWH